MASLAVDKLIDGFEAFSQALDPAFMNGTLGRELYPRLASKLLILSAETAGLGPFLDEIPSETTPSERRFIYSFFAKTWKGQANVLEIGPFLGGTTRAVAHGMIKNPKMNPDALIYTYDRFSNYYDTARLAQTLEPLIAKGALDRSKIASLGKEAPFKEVFDMIHGPKPYGKIIRSMEGILPDSPEENGKVSPQFRPPEGKRFDAVFVDGCKSWFGTKEFMKQMAPCVNEGAFFIFQDYGWFTCFWIPAFTAIFGANFELVGFTDNTYAFHYRKALSADEIEKNFPDAPEKLGARIMMELFSVLQSDSLARNDGYGIVCTALQQVASQAYLGELDTARALLQKIRDNPAYRPFMDLVNTATKSPAYRPEGKVFL
jgi:hypothetical protein